MRVNIQYSVDFKDIPKEVERLLEEIKDNISLKTLLGVDDVIKSTRQEKNIHETIIQIDEIRQHLSKIDFRLMDCSAILAGYQKTLADLDAPSDPPSTSKRGKKQT